MLTCVFCAAQVSRGTSRVQRGGPSGSPCMRDWKAPEKELRFMEERARVQKLDLWVNIKSVRDFV